MSTNKTQCLYAIIKKYERGVLSLCGSVMTHKENVLKKQQPKGLFNSLNIKGHLSMYLCVGAFIFFLE